MPLIAIMQNEKITSAQEKPSRGAMRICMVHSAAKVLAVER